MKMKKLHQSTLMLMGVIVFSKILGMARDVVLANYFGTSKVSDAFLIAVSVPTALFYFIGHGISTAYLPMYNKIRKTSGDIAANRYTDNLACVSMIMCTLFVVVLLVWPKAIIRLFAAGFDAETVDLTSKFIRRSAVSLYCMVAINLWGGYLNGNNSFLVPAAVSVPRNLAIMFAVVLAAYYDVEIMGWGLLAAYIGEMLFLLPSVLKNGYRPHWYVNVRDSNIKETIYIVMPIVLGISVGQLNKIIDRSIASTIISGGISALSYAAVINSAIQSILVTGMITVLFAKCSVWVAEEKHEIVKQKLAQTIKILISLLIPASLGIMVLSEEIVRCMMSRGEFNEWSEYLTAGALRCYTVGLTFLALRDTLVKVFYAYKDTKITAATSICAILVNIVLNLVLSKLWGINGLAIATSVSAIFQSALLYVLLRKKIGDFELGDTMITGVKVLVSSVLMGGCVAKISIFMENLGCSNLEILSISFLTGVCFYFIFSLLFKTETSFMLCKYVRKRVLNR